MARIVFAPHPEVTDLTFAAHRQTNKRARLNSFSRFHLTSMTAACTGCSLDRQALKPINYDMATWSQFSRCSCQQYSCQAPVRHLVEASSPDQNTPPAKHVSRGACATPEKALADATPEEARCSASADDTGFLLGSACALLDEVVMRCPQQTASKNMYGAIFHSVSVPDISAATYLSRHLLRLGLAMKEDMTEATLLHTFVLLDRLHVAQSRSGFHLCSANVHRVLLSLVVISAKLVDDEPYTNTYWASCGGVDLPHLNDLEIYAMKCLDHRMHVTVQEMDGMRLRLVGNLDLAAAA